MMFHASYNWFCFVLKYFGGVIEKMYSIRNMVLKRPHQVYQGPTGKCLVQHWEQGDIATKEFLENIYSHVLLTVKLNAFNIQGLHACFSSSLKPLSILLLQVTMKFSWKVTVVRHGSSETGYLFWEMEKERGRLHHISEHFSVCKHS